MKKLQFKVWITHKENVIIVECQDSKYDLETRGEREKFTNCQSKQKPSALQLRKYLEMNENISNKALWDN